MYSKPRPWLYRSIVTVILLIAGGAIVIGTRATTDVPVPATERGLERVYPLDGKTVLRQSTVLMDLAEPIPTASGNTVGFSGQLTINGHPIPQDQFVFVDGTRQYSFTPGPGKEFESFEAGRVCAEARFWPDDLGPSAAKSYNWCFNAS